jgi:hypothetical protein
MLKLNDYGRDVGTTVGALKADRVERLLRWDGFGERP